MELNGDTLKVTDFGPRNHPGRARSRWTAWRAKGTIAAPAKLMLDSLKEFPELPLDDRCRTIKNWEIKIKLEERFALDPRQPAP